MAEYILKLTDEQLNIIDHALGFYIDLANEKDIKIIKSIIDKMLTEKCKIINEKRCV